MFFDFNTHNWTILINTLGTFYSLYLLCQKSGKFMLGSNKQWLGWLLVIFTTYYVGDRPVWMYADSRLYSEMFMLVQRGEWEAQTTLETEWMWVWLQDVFIENSTCTRWFLAIMCIYAGGIAFAAWRWTRRHFTMAIMFAFLSFSFWSYSNNGIRQGMAASLVIAGLACVTPEVRHNWLKLLPCIVLCILGFGTHNAMLLLFMAGLAAFFVQNRKLAYYVWFVCLLLSPLSQLFQGVAGDLISDERMAHYVASEDAELFNRTGWRWDFILYSSVPVVLGYYIEFKRKVKDWTYNFIMSCYLYTNAAWMLINAVPYSNRYAYISWCLYPFLLAYPLANIRFAKRQSVLAAVFLIGCMIFNALF